MKHKIRIIAYLIIFVIFILLSINFYFSRDSYPPSIDMFLDNPAKYAGKVTEFISPVINTSEQAFYASVNQKPLKVYYSGLEKPKLGQIYVKAELNSDGTATALEVHKFSYNYIKYIISFLAFFLFLFIFFREWRFEKWRFVENA